MALASLHVTLLKRVTQQATDFVPPRNAGRADASATVRRCAGPKCEGATARFRQTRDNQRCRSRTLSEGSSARVV